NPLEHRGFSNRVGPFALREIADQVGAALVRDEDSLRIIDDVRTLRAAGSTHLTAETDASVHDSQQLDQLLDRSNTGSEVWADSAYFSAETEAALKSKGYQSRIHRRGVRNRPLSQR